MCLFWVMGTAVSLDLASQFLKSLGPGCCHCQRLVKCWVQSVCIYLRVALTSTVDVTSNPANGSTEQFKIAAMKYSTGTTVAIACTVESLGCCCWEFLPHGPTHCSPVFYWISVESLLHCLCLLLVYLDIGLCQMVQPPPTQNSTTVLKQWVGVDCIELRCNC